MMLAQSLVRTWVLSLEDVEMNKTGVALAPCVKGALL